MILRFKIFLILFSFSLAVKSQDLIRFDDCKTEIESLIKNDLEKAYILTEKLERSALKRSDSLDLLEAYNYFGVIYNFKNDRYKALEFHYKALNLKKKYSKKTSISNTLNSIATIHHRNGNFDKALNFYLQSISVLDDSISEYQSTPRINICNLYLDINELDKAKEEIENTADYLKIINNKIDASLLDNLRGIYFQAREEFDSSKYYYEKNLNYNLLHDDSSKIAHSYNNLAIIYYYEGHLEHSLSSFKKAYAIRKNIKDTTAILESIYNLGDFQQELNNYDSALVYFNEGLTLSKNQNSNLDTRDFYRMISNIYEKQGKKDLALENYKNYIEYHTKATSEKNLKRIKELEAKYKFNQQQKEIKQVKESNHFLTDANIKIKKLNTLSYLFIALLISLIIYISKLLYSNKKLAESLKETTISKTEKETLIKEIHHRVKNNLQIIISLLRLQASTIDDKKTVEHFTECEQRIAAMALVHDRLYKSSNFSEIDLPTYIDELTGNLITSFSAIRTRKKSTIEIERLSLDTIIPISLIINECITNSFKHGYSPGKTDFEITCNFIKKPNNIAVLYIGDNGVGFPEGFSLENPNSSLGVELIDSLVDQINGEVKIIRDQGGAYYEITFPL